MSHLLFPCSPQAPPRLTVSLIQTPEGLPLQSGGWSGHPVWPLEVPTTPPDNDYPLASPTSTGMSNSEEEGHEGEEGPLGQGHFKRTRPVRAKRVGGAHRPRELSSSDSTLMHSSSDSTLPKDGGSRCSSPGSSDSDAKTEDTATTMTLLPPTDRGESHPEGILSVLTPDRGLTQKLLQQHGAKKNKPAGTARHLFGESSVTRAAVRRTRREDPGGKESPGTGVWL